jgi:hypothetical protein
MGRLVSNGAELNSTTNDVEVETVSGTVTVDSGIFRSGNYSYKINPTASNAIIDNSLGSQFARHNYGRAYIYLTSLPTANSKIMDFAFVTTSRASLQLTTSGVVQLLDDGGAQVGSDGPTLLINTWYRIELKSDGTTSAGNITAEALVDGVSFASGTYASTDTSDNFRVGFLSGSPTGTMYVDDIAVNDTSGSFQNSWPGEGKIIVLKPNAAGDTSAWTGDYTDIDEITPDDSTTFISSNTATQVEDVNLESSGLTSETITFVGIGVRFSGAGASANASFIVRVKASSGGTVQESFAITPSNTTWLTNATVSSNRPQQYPIALYDLPGASTTAWTPADLDQAQIGVRLSTASTNAARVSKLWMLVEYVPLAGGGTPQSSNALFFGSMI